MYCPNFRRELVMVLNWTMFTSHQMHLCKRIKPTLTPGPDGYPPFLIKQIISSIAGPLSAMYQSFMSVGKVPVDWKIAFITPSFKKGASSDHLIIVQSHLPVFSVN